MDFDKNNPYAPPVEIDEAGLKEKYDLHGLVVYYNKTTFWGFWFARLFLIDCFLFLFWDVMPWEQFEDGRVNELIFVSLAVIHSVIHLATVVLFFVMLYLAFRLCWKVCSRFVFFVLIITAIMTGGCVLVISLLPVRAKTKRILEKEGFSHQKEYFDLTSLKHNMDY